MHWRAHYHRKVARDPAWQARVRERRRIRESADPVLEARKRATWRRSAAKKRQRALVDPGYLAARRRQKNDWYAANAERIQQKRRGRFDALTPIEREVIRSRARALNAALARIRRARLAADPAKWQEFQASVREARRRRALRKISQMGAVLEERLDSE